MQWRRAKLAIPAGYYGMSRPYLSRGFGDDLFKANDNCHDNKCQTDCQTNAQQQAHEMPKYASLSKGNTAFLRQTRPNQNKAFATSKNSLKIASHRFSKIGLNSSL